VKSIVSMNENGETLIRRVRNARNLGMELADIQDQFASEFSREQVYLAWHAACILDKQSDKQSD
jgi:hypothetical protein